MATNTTEPTFTVELTEAQRSIVLGALIDKKLNVKQYMDHSKVADEPRATDSCCAAHLARYEQEKVNYLALKAQKKAVSDTIVLFGIEGDRG